MTTTINKVDNFLEAFPNKVIRHTRRSDYEVLNNIIKALKPNFATVPCTLGCGTHGYLGAVLTSAEYTTATPNNTPPFVDPLFPGSKRIKVVKPKPTNTPIKVPTAIQTSGNNPNDTPITVPTIIQTFVIKKGIKTVDSPPPPKMWLHPI